MHRHAVFRSDRSQRAARRRRRSRGQTLSEYVIVLVMFIGVALMLTLFLAIFMEQGARILKLIGLEYP